MHFDDRLLSDSELIRIYRKLLLPRLVEEKMLILLRQGKISKWFSGLGQEAIPVGVALSLEEEDFILPMHRNLGVFTSRGVSLYRLFAQFQGKRAGFTKGRDRSFHFGIVDHRIVGMISHLGQQLGVADGVALAEKLQKTENVTVVFTGDGGASEGDFHEALNTAAVWDLPVIFIVENNQWGLSTPSEEQFRCNYFIDKGVGYGIEAFQMDGNNVLEVCHGMKEIVAKVRATGKPILVEMITFRIRGHEEASGTKYYPEGLQDLWKKSDPIDNYEKFLIEKQVLAENQVRIERETIKRYIDGEWNKALNEPDIVFSPDEELNDVYAAYDMQTVLPNGKTTNKRLIDAIHEGLDIALERHKDLVFMGQDIAAYGGVFKATDGLKAKYGGHRIRNTPLCESAILGSTIGLSVRGMRSMVEMQFADFVSEGMTQIANNIAKLHWRWGQNVNTVIRMPTGAGVAAGPFHSQSNEAWFAHIPGLKIVYPSTPTDAKGLLLQAFEDPNPVMFFEHKALYRSLREEVPDGYYTLPIGESKVVLEGIDVTVVTYGMGVHWALDYQKEHSEKSLELIDLRTLQPLDLKPVFKSVQKTGRVFILHEDTLFGGLGGEISAQISEHCFEFLDAPIMRLGSLDTAVPFSAELEKGFLAVNRMKEKMEQLLNY
jgi:2-oxoisovalerate dehydrogenase E1 component